MIVTRVRLFSLDVSTLDDPDLELVPGEVTRDEMEDKNHGRNKADDHDEYEIYETIKYGVSQSERPSKDVLAY